MSVADGGRLIFMRTLLRLKILGGAIPPNKIFHLGIGLKRGIGAEAIEDAVDRAFMAQGLSRRAIRDVSSIEQKQDEAGLLSFARAHDLHTNFYRAETLQSLPGTFAASAFVKKTVGTDNVCERAAVLSAQSSADWLLLRKTVGEGCTLALACCT